MALGPLTVAEAQQSVRVRVDYTFSAIQADGRDGRADWTVGAVLSGTNQVTDSFEGRSRGGAMSGGRSETLGGGRWRVLGPNELMRVTDWPNSQTIVRVSVSGKSCQATVESRLKPGKTTYVFRRISDRSMVEMRDPSYSNIRCTIE